MSSSFRKQLTLSQVLASSRKISIAEVNVKDKSSIPDLQLRFDLVSVYGADIKDRMGMVPIEFRIDWMQRVLSELRQIRTPKTRVLGTLRFRDVAELHKFLDIYIFLILEHYDRFLRSGDIFLNINVWNLPHNLKDYVGTWQDVEAKKSDKWVEDTSSQKVTIAADGRIESCGGTYYNPCAGVFTDGLKSLHEITGICRTKGVHSLLTPEDLGWVLNVHPKLIQVKNSKGQNILNVFLSNIVNCAKDYKEDMNTREFKKLLKEMNFEGYLNAFLRSPYARASLLVPNPRFPKFSYDASIGMHFEIYLNSLLRSPRIRTLLSLSEPEFRDSDKEPHEPREKIPRMITEPNLTLIKDKIGFKYSEQKPRLSVLEKLLTKVDYVYKPIEKLDSQN